jgi:hypothetical protein
MEFSQLHKHSSISRWWYPSATLWWPNTRPGHCIITKLLRHGAPTWLKKQAKGSPIYSSEVWHWMSSAPQLVWRPYPQHCYHVKHEVLVCFLGALTHQPPAWWQLFSFCPYRQLPHLCLGQVLQCTRGAPRDEAASAWYYFTDISNGLFYLVWRAS